MDNFIEFMKQYDALKNIYPDLYIHIREFSKEPRRWRVHVFYKGAHFRKGDAELLFVEAEEREEAFKLAKEKLRGIDTQIYNIKEIAR